MERSVSSHPRPDCEADREDGAEDNRSEGAPDRSLITPLFDFIQQECSRQIAWSFVNERRPHLRSGEERDWRLVVGPWKTDAGRGDGVGLEDENKFDGSRGELIGVFYRGCGGRRVRRAVRQIS